MRPNDWLIVKKEGLYCIPGRFYIDPKLPVASALITHAHGDHAISGHKQVLTTPETCAILRLRYGIEFAQKIQALVYRKKLKLNDVIVYFLPAGHILGSAQIVIEYLGQRVLVSGDYKRQPDPTCESYEPLSCDVFITEATFGLPIFKHPPISTEIAKLLQSIQHYSNSCHVIGVYSLGKCQRLIVELRKHGYDEPIFLHPAKIRMCDVYSQFGIAFGQLNAFDAFSNKSLLKGKILLVSPSSIHDRWIAKLPEPVVGLATGWMRIRARAKQQGVELPLIISDHADWEELKQTINENNPGEIWVTHGQEDALVYYAKQQGFEARALDIWRDELEAEA